MPDFVVIDPLLNGDDEPYPRLFLVSVAMLKSPLVAGKSPRSVAGVEVSSGAVTSLVVGVAHAERLAVGDHDAGVME